MAGAFRHLNVTLSSVRHPCESDSGTAFLRSRLALFAKLLFILVTAFFLLMVGLAVASTQYTVHCCYELPSSRVHLLTAGLLGGLWWLYSRPGLCRTALYWWDMGSTIALCALFAAIGRLEGLFSVDPHVILLASTYTLISRAIVVPSSPARTLLISTAASLSAAIAGGMKLFQQYAESDAAAAVRSVVVYGAWYVVAIVVATVASRVIYGLQRKVEEARQLGQYTLEEKLGSGGMGEVYRASHSMLRRPTAIKLLPVDKAGALSVARFEREVQLTSQLTHPNTIAIYDYGRTPDGIFYYAMEYLPGLNLEDLVSRFGPLSSARTIHVLRQACGSLSEAHEAGLIHRDIKPANFLLTERGGVCDVVKVVDFGLVKDVDESAGAGVSAANTIAGTPLYLSPEALRSETVDARSDLYALGGVAYYLLTGTHVFEGASFMEIAGKHLHAEPEAPSKRLGRPIPADLEAIVLRCLSKRAAGRPASARDLQAALEGCEDAGGWGEAEAAAWWDEHEDAFAAPAAESESAETAGATAGEPTVELNATRTAVKGDASVSSSSRSTV